MRTNQSSTWAHLYASVFTVLFLLMTATVLPAQTLTTLASFAGPDGNNSQAALLQTSGGSLYGVTVYGGDNNLGTVFQINPAGVLTTIHSFAGTDGSNPWPALINGHDGFFYGTTHNGGSGSACGGGCGTAFKITPSGAITTLHNFTGTDGGYPQGGLIQGTDGNFYGSTLNDALGGCALGCGTIFKVSSTGAFSTLHKFTGGADGGYVYSTLIQATDGNFYGVTFTGGGADEGTVFRMTPSGTVTTIHDFCLGGVPCPDGGNALGGLVQAKDGNLYGTTPRGGDGSCILLGFEGCGTIFQISLSGTFTTLHLFDLAHGGGPLSRMIQGTDGNLYGVTTNGGASSACTDGCGTIFKMSTAGAYSVLYSFCSLSGCTDGSVPIAGVIQGPGGKFYGTTATGGASNMGVIYSLP
jgi:uncharacterized repeat protein (TIGR03803 family)